MRDIKEEVSSIINQDDEYEYFEIKEALFNKVVSHASEYGVDTFPLICLDKYSDDVVYPWRNRQTLERCIKEFAEDYDLKYKIIDDGYSCAPRWLKLRERKSSFFSDIKSMFKW